jgi:hypothetical protein
MGDPLPDSTRGAYHDWTTIILFLPNLNTAEAATAHLSPSGYVARGGLRRNPRITVVLLQRKAKRLFLSALTPCSWQSDPDPLVSTKTGSSNVVVSMVSPRSRNTIQFCALLVGALANPVGDAQFCGRPS